MVYSRNFTTDGSQQSGRNGKGLWSQMGDIQMWARGSLLKLQFPQLTKRTATLGRTIMLFCRSEKIEYYQFNMAHSQEHFLPGVIVKID
jgi:hypothetical protein